MEVIRCRHQTPKPPRPTAWLGGRVHGKQESVVCVIVMYESCFPIPPHWPSKRGGRGASFGSQEQPAHTHVVVVVSTVSFHVFFRFVCFSACCRNKTRPHSCGRALPCTPVDRSVLYLHSTLHYTRAGRCRCSPGCTAYNTHTIPHTLVSSSSFPLLGFRLSPNAP